jgi:hypothetical protein
MRHLVTTSGMSMEATRAAHHTYKGRNQSCKAPYSSARPSRRRPSLSATSQTNRGDVVTRAEISSRLSLPAVLRSSVAVCRQHVVSSALVVGCGSLCGLVHAPAHRDPFSRGEPVVSCRLAA